jgi:uncharacterized protein YdeI (YjbR/CyaY-like superfamily)
MSRHDPRIDAYIAQAAEFARPILEAARERVHAASAEIEEAIKWGMPTFMYRGKILCGMAAFKQHASFGFWQHALVLGEGVPREGMGSFGKMTSLKDLPSKARLLPLLKKAMALIDEGVASPVSRKSATPKPVPPTPTGLVEALAGNEAARSTFEAFSPSQRREYIEWINEAKREETRAKRVAQSVEWLSEGKQKNWKYQRC